jgi:hypothetical protein
MIQDFQTQPVFTFLDDGTAEVLRRCTWGKLVEFADGLEVTSKTTCLDASFKKGQKRQARAVVWSVCAETGPARG